MIVIDTSAVIAILQAEPEEAQFVAAVLGTNDRLISAASYVESAMVASSRRGILERLDAWLHAMELTVVDVDLAQAQLAVNAFLQFGKGRHPAGLNYGDCFAYALAASRDAPLLYKGTDFDKTDIRSALTSLA